MKKPLLLMIGPFGTRSGYGAHARDLFHAFYDLDRYEIQLFDTKWGDTPRNALKNNNSKDKLILDRILKSNQLKKQPDVCVDVRIPNEFQNIGKYNVGITAGIESHIVSAPWIEGSNKMDLVIVPSNHSKSGFTTPVYDKMQDLPNGEKQKVGELRLEKPIEVLFEGVDTDVYKPLEYEDLEKSVCEKMDNVKEDFAFLFVGQWTKGGYGEDRKDIGRMLKVFFEAFANNPSIGQSNRKQPALI